jgi:fumarate reductase subunit D
MQPVLPRAVGHACVLTAKHTCCCVGAWTIAALPAMQAGSGSTGRAAGLVVPLWLLVAAWWAWLGWQGRRHLRSFLGTRLQACKVRLVILLVRILNSCFMLYLHAVGHAMHRTALVQLLSCGSFTTC